MVGGRCIPSRSGPCLPISFPIELKVLQIITSLRTGGAERVVVDLAKQFRESGDDVAILLLDGTRTPMLEEAETAGIEVHALSKVTRYDDRYQFYCTGLQCLPDAESMCRFTSQPRTGRRCF